MREEPMARQALANSRRRSIVQAAIAHADKGTSKDPRAYVDALRNYALARLPIPKAGGGGARSLGLRPKAAKGARLADDPRYLTNVQELARRTKRNARIIGGSTVTGKEFADCVAVGDDENWGCTGTLIAPNVVLTAGHCMKLHTRIFVGN